MGPPKISVFFRLLSFLSGCKCFLYFSSLFGELLSVHPIPTHFALLPITDIFSSLIPQKISFLLFTDIFHRFSRFHGYIPLWLYEVAKLSFFGLWRSLGGGEAFMLYEEERAGGNSFCSGSPKAWIRHHEWNLHGSNVARSEMSVTHRFSKFSWPFII